MLRYAGCRWGASASQSNARDPGGWGQGRCSLYRGAVSRLIPYSLYSY